MVIRRVATLGATSVVALRLATVALLSKTDKENKRAVPKFSF